MTAATTGRIQIVRQCASCEHAAMNDADAVSVLAVGRLIDLGVPDDEATVWFGETPKAEGAWSGNRVLYLKQDPAFELSFWCGTCAFLFRRKEGANQTVSLEGFRTRLADGVSDVDRDIVRTFGELLGADSYVPLLLRVSPTLVQPMEEHDYFSHEQVETWGLTGFWGLPEYPSTPYYRTFQTAVNADAHLYEFITPMVPPSWNDAARVEEYIRRMRAGAEPTAVAVSTLDVCQSATDAPGDYYAHWGLTHFLLDGHHKVEAAARCGRPLTLLALVGSAASLCDEAQLKQLPDLRQRVETVRPRT